MITNQHNANSTVKNPSIRFTKMHGLGNDFVLINAIDQALTLDPIHIQKLANRYIGIGFDQLLMVSPSHRADFFCHIFNADGSIAFQCGNGLRCIARFLHEEKFINNNTISLETKSGIYTLTIHDIHTYHEIEVKMGIPTIVEPLTSLNLPSTKIEITEIDIGNPHVIVKVNSIDSANILQLTEEIKAHSRFRLGINIGLMQILDRTHILLRTYERGVGETQSCGSNACAAVVAGIKNGWLQNKVDVQLRYGTLHIKWDKDMIYLIGPASRVYTGVFDAR